MKSTKTFSFVTFLLIGASCSQNNSGTPEVHSGRNNNVVDNMANKEENSSDVLAGVTPASPEESLFVGDSENKVRSVLKASLVEDKTTVVRDTAYFANDIRTNVRTYSVSHNGAVTEMYLVANDILRNCFVIMGTFPNNKQHGLVSAIKSDYIFVKRGVYKSADSKKSEFIMFLLIEQVKKKRVTVAAITGPNSNFSDTDRLAFISIMSGTINKRQNWDVKTSFIE